MTGFFDTERSVPESHWTDSYTPEIPIFPTRIRVWDYFIVTDPIMLGKVSVSGKGLE